jgi:hypothetical protein
MVTIGSDPMLKSMTGYGRAEGATAPYLYTVEVFTGKFANGCIEVASTSR